MTASYRAVGPVPASGGVAEGNGEASHVARQSSRNESLSSNQKVACHRPQGEALSWREPADRPAKGGSREREYEGRSPEYDLERGRIPPKCVSRKEECVEGVSKYEIRLRHTTSDETHI